MKLKKILVIGMTSFPGGMERYLVNWFQNMDKSQYQIDFLNQESEQLIAYTDYINKYGGSIVNVVKRKGHFLRHYWELKKLYRKNKYDIVYYNTLDLANVDFLIMAELFSKNAIKVVHAHNSNSLSSGIRLCLIKIHTRFIEKLSDVRLACSYVAGDWMFQGTNYKVIHNAIDLNKFSFCLAKKQEMLSKLGIMNKKIWGTVGRLGEQKNPLFLIEIMRCVHSLDKDIVFLHIGDGPMKQIMQEKIKEYGLEEVYFLLGKINNVEDYYQIMDKFVFPSIYEGLPLTLIEAQAVGIKCFVSDKVSLESDLQAGLFTSLSLSAGPREWASIIMETEALEDAQKPNCIKYVKKAGYDLNDFTFMKEILK